MASGANSNEMWWDSSVDETDQYWWDMEGLTLFREPLQRADHEINQPVSIWIEIIVLLRQMISTFKNE